MIIGLSTVFRKWKAGRVRSQYTVLEDRKDFLLQTQACSWIHDDMPYNLKLTSTIKRINNHNAESRSNTGTGSVSFYFAEKSQDLSDLSTVTYRADMIKNQNQTPNSHLSSCCLISISIVVL